MPRKRTRRHDLPERVYYSHGAYYYVINNKWTRLDSDYSKAMVAWTKLVHAKRDVQTIGDLLDRYALEVIPGKAARTQKDNREEMRWLRAFFGNMDVKDVSAGYVHEYARTREAKTRGNREIALLSHAFSKAILWGVVSNNPCSTPGLRNKETPRERYVTDEELHEFKKVCEPWLATYVDIKSLIGLRKQDMLALKWADLSETHLTVHTRKTGKRLRLALTPELSSLIASLPKRGTFFWMTKQGTQYTTSGFDSTWKRRMRKYQSLGNETFHEHDIRGKVATDMEDAGAAQKLLGHKSIKMTEAYIKQRSIDEVQPLRRK